MSGGFDDDRGNLIGDGDGDGEAPQIEQRRPKKRRLLLCLALTLAAVLIACGHAGAVYFIYYRCEPSSCAPIRVMSLNTWGMPAAFGSLFKEDRMKAIAEEFSKGEYDLYLFEELWMRPDYETIRDKTPKGFVMTSYGSLTYGDCDGRWTPAGCSGLALASRFPLRDVQFHRYSDSGDAAKSFVDGEYLANKGVGRVRIEVLNRTKVDVLITHTAADPDPSHGYNNSYYRVRQVRELVEHFLKLSDADVVLLGGDFNAGPDHSPEAPYGMIRKYMKNCVEDVFYTLSAWLNPQFATYANQKNTFSYGIVPPVIYDYIFHRNQNGSMVQVWTNWFELPFFKFPIKRGKRSTTEGSKVISFSDHEAVISTIYIREL